MCDGGLGGVWKERDTTSIPAHPSDAASRGDSGAGVDPQPGWRASPGRKSGWDLSGNAAEWHIHINIA